MGKTWQSKRDFFGKTLEGKGRKTHDFLIEQNIYKLEHISPHTQIPRLLKTITRETNANSGIKKWSNMPPPPPPFYPEADEQDSEARINAVAAAITRLVRILGLGKGQTEAEPVSERNPSIPIGGADEQSYVFLDEPREPSPIRASTTTANMCRTSQRRPRAVAEFLPEGVGNSGGHVSNVLLSALPSSPSAAFVIGDPPTEEKHSLGGRLLYHPFAT